VSALVGHKGTGAQWLLAATAQEAVLMPRLSTVLQLSGSCGEQESTQSCVPRVTLLTPSLYYCHCSYSFGRVVSMHMQQDPHHVH
jgi:hypothetical protein